MAGNPTEFLSRTGYRLVTAEAATALTPGADINGVLFNGTMAITITAAAGTLTGTTLAAGVTASSLTSVGTLTNLTVTNPIMGSITGNSATVTINANLTGPITSVGNATTISGSIALPGSPTTTTQTVGDNSTKIATTAFVNAAVSASGTVTSIATGTGLTGGPITSTGTISIANATANTLAGYNNSGVFSDVAIGTGLSLSGGTLSATGGGTVTSVSVTTANGVSGTVATATTTPAITLTLGAITPTSVNSVVISGSSTPTLAVTGTTTVSGSNTGDQTNISGNAATVTTNANLTGPIISLGNATSIASQTGTGTKFVVDTSPTLVTPNIGTATGTGLILTSSSANAFAVGQNGSTHPALQVDASTTSAVTGIYIQSRIAGASALLSVNSSAASEGLILVPKADGALILSTSTFGTLQWLLGGLGGSIQAQFTHTAFSFTPDVTSTASTLKFSFVGAADTGLDFGTEAVNVFFNMAQTRQHSNNNAITLQRDMRIAGSTHSFATSGGVITDTAALSISLPKGGTNTTLTNSHGIYIPSFALSNTTNGFAQTLVAPTGATNNFVQKLSGYVLKAGTGDTIAAGTGAGSSPTISIAGPPQSGIITLTTGTLPTLAATIATITYGTTFPTGSIVVLTPANSNAALLTGATMVYAAGGTANFVITAGATALTAATQYIWNYAVTAY